MVFPKIKKVDTLSKTLTFPKLFQNNCVGHKMNLYPWLSIVVLIIIICTNIDVNISLIIGCSNPESMGNRICNDENNIEACFFDGGDCCGSYVFTDYCTVCQCLSDGGLSVANGTCSNQYWVADYFCDDGNNNEGCNYDGGDCCESWFGDVWGFAEFCNECLCHSTGVNGTCLEYQIWFGDGYCDDVINNQECNYDGGDCCGGNVNTDYCDECFCFPNSVNGTFCNQDWVNDDYCDDDNNHQKCNYDGGDCCGDYVNTDWCDECLCLE